MSVQILIRRSFEGAHEQEKESNTFSPHINREAKIIGDKSAKGKDIIAFKPHTEHQRTKRIKGRKLGCKNLKLFTFICGKDHIPQACIYRTLNSNRVGNLADSTGAHVGKKVLPITEASFSSSTTERKDQCVPTETRDQNKGDRKKLISRMKELFTWAAKTDKKGKQLHEQKILQFQRQGSTKAVPEEYQLSSESPKIDFTWDMEEIHSITSSVYSLISSIASLSRNGQTQIAHSPIYTPPEESHDHHITFRKGNWITTDSEFVVLELV